MRSAIPGILALLMAACGGNSAQIDPAGQVDALFAPFADGVRPGAAVMVIQDGTIVHSSGYGYADIPNRVPITADSIFRLGSVSKQFTAMAIAILADRELLDYDNLASEYVPCLATFGEITVRHLLTHTSGLPDYYDEFDASRWVAEGTMPSNADVIDYLCNMGALLFEPGERYEYSNPAYEVLPLIVEAVTGKIYAEFMREEVFQASGMTSSVIHDHRRPDIERRVLGYSETPDGFELNDEDPLNGIVGSGSQFSSLNDFFYWDSALDTEKLHSTQSREQVFSRALLNSGEEIDYGFGWRLDEYKGHRRIAHGGSWIGFRTAISRYPDAGLTVVVLMNFEQAEPEQLADRIADIYLGSE